MIPIRAAFVMEQTLGHVTHFKNLRGAAERQTALAPTWLPIDFEPLRADRYLPLLRSNWSVRASWRARRALGAALRAQPHQAVVFHTQVTSLFSVDVMRRLPAVISLDATPLNFDSVAAAYNHRPAGNGWIDRRKLALNRSALGAAAAVVAWSEWARRSLIDDYGVDGRRVRVIAPGAAQSYFDVGERRAAAGGESDGRRVRLLFVGGDFTRKGGPQLLECMRGPLGERCELHVVTKEALPPQPNVHVYRGLGPNSPELLRLYATADAFVLPTLADCLAVVLMEATAAGLPVVTTDVGALSEAVLPGESGLLVPPGDAPALRAALEALVDDPGLRRRMGRAGHDLAQRKFHADRNNKALLDLVADVAGVAGAAHRRPGAHDARRIA